MRRSTRPSSIYLKKYFPFQILEQHSVTVHSFIAKIAEESKRKDSHGGPAVEVPGRPKTAPVKPKKEDKKEQKKKEKKDNKKEAKKDHKKDAKKEKKKEKRE